ncbi:11690_t:CDS:2, partial [Ambispora leptoticha]
RYKTAKESSENDKDKNTGRALKARKELVVSTKTKRRKIDEELPENEAKLTKITRIRRRKETTIFNEESPETTTLSSPEERLKTRRKVNTPIKKDSSENNINLMKNYQKMTQIHWKPPNTRKRVSNEHKKHQEKKKSKIHQRTMQIREESPENDTSPSKNA